MKTFVCTFEGFATMYIEATDKDAARDKALKRAVESDDIISTNKLTIQEVN